jgi:hypothetical protein
MVSDDDRWRLTCPITKKSLRHMPNKPKTPAEKVVDALIVDETKTRDDHDNAAKAADAAAAAADKKGNYAAAATARRKSSFETSEAADETSKIAGKQLVYENANSLKAIRTVISTLKTQLNDSNKAAADADKAANDPKLTEDKRRGKAEAGDAEREKARIKQKEKDGADESAG